MIKIIRNINNFDDFRRSRNEGLRERSFITINNGALGVYLRYYSINDSLGIPEPVIDVIEENPSQESEIPFLRVAYGFNRTEIYPRGFSHATKEEAEMYVKAKMRFRGKD